MISRILVLIKMDMSAMMGFTGAVFRDFFGSQAGFLATIAILLGWIIISFSLSLRRFNRKDL